MSDISNNPYYKLFLKQKANQLRVGKSTYNQRIKKLNALQRAIEITYRDQIIKVLKHDLGKPTVESEMSEIYQVISDIKFAKSNLRRWMRKQKVKTPLSMLGSSSYYIYESKGVCLIISPWNFPINLTFGPLVSAIAAGNTVIIKPSEITPGVSSLMSKIVTELFNEDEVALIEGEVDVATKLLQLPFNHIFFTGSPKVGKIVMKAAAEHLTSVTLELGGKSPTLIDATANIDTAAKKIVWGKFLNAGQTCIAPDYLLIEESIKTKFIQACKKWISAFYTEQPEDSNSLGRIVSKTHFDRLVSYLENAEQKNGKVHAGGLYDADRKFIAPTMISDLNAEAQLLEDEIFGPILPIVTFQTIEEAIAYINSKERPLALYIYSKNKTNIKKVIQNTRAGGTCINNNIIQYANHHLPFGGINNSGIGKSHGFYGFKAFSNERSIVKQHTFGVSELLFPPYSSYKERMARFTIKWF